MDKDIERHCIKIALQAVKGIEEVSGCNPYTKSINAGKIIAEYLEKKGTSIQEPVKYSDPSIYEEHFKRGVKNNEMD